MGDKVPRLVSGVDVRQFKLEPMDGFVMTRIDGTLRERELARETGLPEFAVARAIDKLVDLGIVERVAPGAPAAAAAPPPPPARPRASAIAEYSEGLLAPKYDPSELEAPSDLTFEQRKRIVDLFYRLDDLDHYTLLGTTREADRRTIKRAYFELAAVFHPDRYFKKDLGAYKPKLEIVFNRVTEAHDTLADAAKRAEYDAYLAEVATTHGMEAMLERAIEEAARAAPAPEPSAAAGEPPAPRQPIPSPPPSQPSGAPSRPSVAPTTEELQRRREALARRLAGGRVSAAPRSAPTESPSSQRSEATSDAVDALRRRYEARVEGAAAAHTQRYVESAEAALAKGEMVAASTAFDLAVKLAPDDAALAARAREVRQLANQVLAETYRKQAEQDERQQQWAEAARSWVKLANIKDDAYTHTKAATALLRSPAPDLHRAAEHAKRAIACEPQAVESHVLLVEVYVNAGLTASARRAAETARSLDPKHAGLQALVKRIGRP